MIKSQPQPVELWTYARISEHTGIATGTLRAWRNRGKLPTPDYRIGEYPAWKPDTIRAWWDDIVATNRQGDED